MRHRFVVYAFCLVGFFACKGGAQGLTPQAASAAFHEAEQLSASGQAGLWGRKLYGPMIFVDPTTNEAISNEADSLNNFRQGKVGDVYSGRFPETLQIANTAVEWEGKRWTVIQWPLPQAKLARERLLAHEMFHRLQPGLGIEVEDAPNEQLDSMDGRLWTFLEWRALAAALAASSKEEEKVAISDALLFRQHRRELFSTASLNEQKLELNEGLAEYTGVVVSEPDAASARWHAISRLADPSTSESLVRSFAYTSGPAYGLLLDESKPGWRKNVTARTDLSGLLQVSFETDPRLLEKRAVVYGASALRLRESERKERNDVLKAKYRALLVTGPTLTLPIMDKLNFSFDPGELTPLEEGMVYPALHASDEWGSLEVTEGALVSFPRHLVRVPAPVTGTEGTITGPGWLLKLSPGWVVREGSDKSFLVQKK